MIVNVLQENFTKALVRASRILSAKPQLPILSSVLLKTNDNGLQVTSSNLEITETIRLGAKVEKPGGICVSARLLAELIAALPQEAVSLSVADGSLHVVCQSVKATIPGVPEAEFPPVGAPEAKELLSMKRESFIAALSSVLFSAATDESRPMYTGVLVERGEDGLVFVATDGYRLSKKTMAAGGSKEPLQLVVPARALGEIVKISQEEKGEKTVALAQSQNSQIVATVGDVELVMRLLDGEYPPYQKIIPKTHTTRVHFDRQVLLRAAKLAAIFARDNANIVRVTIGSQAVVVAANTPQVGEGSVDVEAQVDGEGGTIAFNSRFLLDLLNNFPGDELLFEMTGALNPGVFKPVKDETFLHIIMPVRVQG